jgi:nucleoside-diphosphate-sugar epimerase
MRLAVTGAGGFLGRHVLSALADRGRRAVAVVRPGASVPAWSAGHAVVHLDLRHPPNDAFERLGSPDALLHLAWGGLPNYRSPHHLADELPSQLGFLEGMLNSGLQALVITGTCFEYGMQSGCLTEDMEPRPDNPYALAKDTLRRRLESIQSERPFHLTWARLFYLYGEGQAPNSLRPQLERAVARGLSAFDMSGGQQVRDYLPVTTAADHLVTLLERGRNDGIVNVCSGQPITVREQVERWIRDNEWSIQLNLGHYPYPDYEPMSFWGDRGKLTRILADQ